MDIEFHYYSLYLICRACNFSQEDATIIAHSSQLTDDNIHAITVHDGNKHYISLNSATNNFLELLLGVDKTLQAFHFLPGDDEHNKWLTTANSARANEVLNWGVASQNPYLIGIALHAYADTWAHQNFVGSKHAVNAGNGIISAVIPNIGHADFGILPDCVGVRWRDSRLDCEIDNNKRFLECAGFIFDVLARYNSYFLSNGCAPAKAALIERLCKIYGESQRYSYFKHLYRSKARIDNYIKYARDSWGEPLKIYDRNAWYSDAIFTLNNAHYFKSKNYKKSHWYRFQEAVHAYNNYYRTINLLN